MWLPGPTMGQVGWQRTRMQMPGAVTVSSIQPMMNAVWFMIYSFLKYWICVLVTCCDSVTFSSTHADWAGGWGNFFGGSYALYEVQPMLNGKAVYEMNDYCLFWECGRWIINKCSALGACSWSVYSEKNKNKLGLSCAKLSTTWASCPLAKQLELATSFCWDC